MTFDDDDVVIIGEFKKRRVMKSLPPPDLIIVMKYLLKNLLTNWQKEKRFTVPSVNPTEIILIPIGSIEIKNIQTQLAIFLNPLLK